MRLYLLVDLYHLLNDLLQSTFFFKYSDSGLIFIERFVIHPSWLLHVTLVIPNK